MSNERIIKDKLLLLLAFLLFGAVFISVVSILLRVDTSQSSAVIRYWTVEGVADFEKQSPVQLYRFALLPLVSLMVAFIFGGRLYRHSPVAVYGLFALSIVVVSLNTIVGWAVLNLQQ